jgi:hypothetical protein
MKAFTLNSIHLLENLKLDELAQEGVGEFRLRDAVAQDSGRLGLGGVADRGAVAAVVRFPARSASDTANPDLARTRATFALEVERTSQKHIRRVEPPALANHDWSSEPG